MELENLVQTDDIKTLTSVAPQQLESIINRILIKEGVRTPPKIKSLEKEIRTISEEDADIWAKIINYYQSGNLIKIAIDNNFETFELQRTAPNENQLPDIISDAQDPDDSEKDSAAAMNTNSNELQEEETHEVPQETKEGEDVEEEHEHQGELQQTDSIPSTQDLVDSYKEPQRGTKRVKESAQEEEQEIEESEIKVLKTEHESIPDLESNTEQQQQTFEEQQQQEQEQTLEEQENQEQQETLDGQTLNSEDISSKEAEDGSNSETREIIINENTVDQVSASQDETQAN